MKMVPIQFKDQLTYDFATTFLQGAQACSFNVQFDPGKLEIQISNAVMGRLLERVSNSYPVVLPYCSQKEDHWLITGPDRRSLDQTLARVSRFIIPSYAEFANKNRVPQLKLFDPGENQLQQLGSQLYSTGYYNWRSPVKYRQTILEHLNTWLDLEAKQPPTQRKETNTYHNLHQAFQTALGDGNWTEAEMCLHEMQQLNLSTADNLMFLRVQLLAQQQQWLAIWEHPDFDLITRLRMPRAVRAALLAAFYHTKLSSLEKAGDWQGAFDVFQDERSRLGALLTGRFGLIDGPVIRVFAYQAIADVDHNSLTQLREDIDDPQTQKCVEALAKLLPPAPEPTTPPVDPVVEARLALAKDDYDRAMQMTDLVTDVVIKTLLLMEIAFHSGDIVTIDKAMQAYEKLTTTQQEMLRTNRHCVDGYLDFLRKCLQPAPPPKQPSPEAVTSSSRPWLEPVWTPTEKAARDTAWEAICALEARLRRLITIRCQAKYGDTWIITRVKAELRQEWEALQTREAGLFKKYSDSPPPLIDYTYLGDLLILINQEWELFNDVFGSGKVAKRELHRKVEECIPTRNSLAHNRPAPENELKRTEVNCTDLLIQIGGIGDE